MGLWMGAVFLFGGFWGVTGLGGGACCNGGQGCEGGSVIWYV